MGSASAGMGGNLPPADSTQAGYILTTDGALATWEVSSASLPSQGGNSGKYLTTNGTVASWATVSALPDQTGNNGKFLTTDGSSASWGTPASGFITSIGAPAAANTNGLSVSGAALSSTPADATHPGHVTTGTQTFAGDKTFTGELVVKGAISGDTGAYLGSPFGGFYGLAGFVGAVGGYLLITDGNDAYLNAPTSARTIIFRVANATKMIMSGTSLDATGFGNGGSIKLKSPDGTTYTATIANGGTWSIA